MVKKKNDPKKNRSYYLPDSVQDFICRKAFEAKRTPSDFMRNHFTQLMEKENGKKA